MWLVTMKHVSEKSLTAAVYPCTGESKVVNALPISDILGIVLGGRTPALVYAERTGECR